MKLYFSFYFVYFFFYSACHFFFIFAFKKFIKNYLKAGDLAKTSKNCLISFVLKKINLIKKVIIFKAFINQEMNFRFS